MKEHIINKLKELLKYKTIQEDNYDARKAW
jgi:hypothetical protein